MACLWMLLSFLITYLNMVKSDCITPPPDGIEYKFVTSLGTVTGAILESKSVTDTGKNAKKRKFFGFMNMPYVAPMLGDKRWTYPVVLNKWTSEIDGRKFGPLCPQINYPYNQPEGNEDCLQINVFTSGLPSPSAKDKCELRPVIFAIVGWSFSLLGAAEYAPSVHMMNEEVVFVTFQFRHGALGFLSSGDKVFPGNYGIFDQIEALKWCRDNIAQFGGDPNRVTINGAEAGAASVQLLMLSKLAKGLFHATISESGSPLCSWGLETNPKQYYDIVLKELKCEFSDQREIRNCLRGKSLEEILKVQLKIQDAQYFPGNVHFLPVMDSYNGDAALLTDMPRALLEKGNYNHVPSIAGIHKDEGLFYALVFGLNVSTDGTIKSFEALSKWLDPVIHDTLRYANEDKKAHIREAIKKHYFDGVTVTDNEAIYPALTNLIGDGAILSCVNEAIRLQASTAKQPVYAYEFAYRGEPSLANELIVKAKKQNVEASIFKTGVTQNDNTLYLFEISQTQYLFTQKDLEFGRHYNHIYSEFASKKDPSMYIPTWKPCGKGEVNYYQLKSTEPGSMIGEYRKEEIKFWKQTMD